MTLLDALVPMPVSQEPVAMVAKPTRRRRWHRERISQADRQAAQEQLANELRATREATAMRMAREQDELLAKASVLPDGVRVVDQAQEGQAR